MLNAASTRLGRVSLSLAWALSVVFLILSGIGYRVLASYLKVATDSPVELSVPLSDFPVRIGTWVGEDVAISEIVQRVAGNDDYVNRLYIDKDRGLWANVYIAYSARPRTMIGHKPEICYTGGGWVCDNTEETGFSSLSGRSMPCFVHRFHMPAPRSDEIVVLNYYVVNGQVSIDESTFSGLGMRTPNIGGDAARYVAHIQISSVLESSVRTAAKDMTELILGFFPNASGKVKVVGY